MSQDQIVALYESSKSNISEHIIHILEEGELDSNSVVRNFRITATDGKIYNDIHYNLDMIIAIGYRVRSSIVTNFRKWQLIDDESYELKFFSLSELPHLFAEDHRAAVKAYMEGISLPIFKEN